MSRTLSAVTAAAFLFFVSIFFYKLPNASFMTVDKLSDAYWISFLCGTLATLLSLAITIQSCASSQGHFIPPNKLSTLFCILLFGLTSAFNVGFFLNKSSNIKMTKSYYHFNGANVQLKRSNYAILDGEIGRTTFMSIQALFNKKDIKFLELQSEGGLIDEAIRIADFVKKRGITIITNTHCKSACVIIAIGAKSLYASPNAIFGFHQSSATAAQDSQLGRYVAKLGTDKLVSALQDRGAPTIILDQVKKTKPNEMYHLTGEEMYRLGLVKRLIRAN